MSLLEPLEEEMGLTLLLLAGSLSVDDDGSSGGDGGGERETARNSRT